jgi:lipopolysaccharide assembly outer membrane protein LptD (OstA)
MDIGTASFSDLAEWCTRLGLSPRGTRSELESRLYKFYDVIPPRKEEEDGSVILIESAQNTEYFSLEQYGEDYVRLDGGVHLTMRDAKKGYSYTIRADSILFNQTLKLLGASGNVEYRISGEGRDEIFKGESLTLDIDTWEGYFFRGSTFKDRTIEGESLAFRIQGEFISRSSKDFIVMEEADITSSPKLPANYNIKAQKIWIFGPGEWGIKNATLQVGHIPVFFFPFFFYPGDEVLFHPVFGYRTREGTFVQTTTYFLGNRSRSQEPLSFLQLTDQSENDKVKARHGIFLRDTDEKLAKPGWYIKGLLDVYSRLGAYAGIDGDLPGIKPSIKVLKFKGGLGVSRNLYTQKVPGLLNEYTPYWIGEDGNLATFWNSTMVGGVNLPFRFGGTTSFSFALESFSLNLLLESYSDPYIEQDFYDRKEQIDWAKLLENNLLEQKTVTLKDRLTWRVESTYSPRIDFFGPYLSTLSMTRLMGALDLRSKDIPANLLGPESATDPTRRFYYPDTLTMPELALQFGGTLFSTEARRPTPKAVSKGDPKSKDRAKDLRPPWDAEEIEDEEVPSDIYKIPDLRKDIPVTPFPHPFGFNLRYDVRPKIVYEQKTDVKNWLEPRDVRYDFAYSSMTLQNNAGLQYDMKIYESLFQTRGALNLSSQNREVEFFSESLTAQEKDSLLLQAYRFTSLGVSNSLDVATYPLYKTDLFKTSNVRYAFQTSLFKKTFDSLEGSNPVYKEQYFKVTKDMITAHRVSLDAAADIKPITPKIQLSYICPPLDEVFSLSSSLLTGPLTSTVTFQTKNIEDRWVNQPIAFDEYLSIHPEANVRIRYLYDFVEDTPYTLSANLRLWFLTAAFNARYTEPYEFGGVDTGWIRHSKKEFIPSDTSLGIRYLFKPDPYWKNRIIVSAGLNANWTMNLIQYTETALSIGFDLNFSVHRFLDLKFSAQSKNTMTYQYFPSLAENTGRTWRNPLTDLLKSFNFFNSEDRYDSHFKLSSLTFEAVHHLDDWDLTISYTGLPELLTRADGSRDFTWNSLLGIFLRWKPIPEIKSEFRYTKDGLDY